MNKIALVTGSSRGIGKAIAITLAQEGYGVFVHYREKEDKAKEVISEIEKSGGKAYLVQGDLTKEEDVKKIFQTIDELAGKLDLLVNNAGFDYGYLIEDYTMEQIKYLVDLVLVSKMATTKYALPLLKKGTNPSIINIASRMGKEKTIDTVGPYASSQAGVMKWTQCCALEFRDYRIRVNCVAPGLTDTELPRTIMPDQSDWDAIAAKNPSGRVGQPQDVANVVSFLASDKSSYINGESIGVNGGSNLG